MIQSNRNSVVIIVLILAAVAIGVWVAFKFINRHPESTEIITPDPQTVEQGVKAENQARQLQQKAQNAANQN